MLEGMCLYSTNKVIFSLKAKFFIIEASRTDYKIFLKLSISIVSKSVQILYPVIINT